jgi:hypothetical protein
MNSIDIFANTNPAFCSVILYNFCKGYFAVKEKPIPFPLIILPLPIILSGDLQTTFESTNIKTGFLTWVKNNPNLVIGLTRRIEDTYEITKPALEYGVSRKILEVNDNGELLPTNNLIKSPNNDLIENYFKFSARLGAWTGEVQSVKTIFNHLGIRL